MAMAETERAWQQLLGLVGGWTKRETGRAGEGGGERTYRLVLGGKFLEERNRSVFERQPANSAGEVHEDLSYFSLDGLREVGTALRPATYRCPRKTGTVNPGEPVACL